MADVQVSFGANIDKLIEGVTGAIETVKGFGEAFVAAFGVEKIAESIEKFAELGEKIEVTAATLGLSTKAAQELTFIAQSTGTNADSTAQAFERLQVSIQRAQVPTSQQAAALRALGLSARELIGLPLPEQMNRFADAVAKFADGTGKTAAVGALSRGLVQMIPILDQGRAGLDQLRDAADNSGAVMSHQTVTALSTLQRALTQFKATLSGVAGTLVGELAPALTRAVTGTNELIGQVNIAIQTHTVWERVMIGLSTVAQEMTQLLANLGVMAKDVFTMNWGSILADRQAGMDKIAAIQQAGEDKVNAIAKQAAAQYQQILSGAGEGGEAKPQVPAIGEDLANALKAQAEQYQEMIKQAQGAYAVLKAQYSTDAAVHKITVDQETAELKAALDERWAIEQALFQRELGLYAQGSAQYNAILKQQQAAYQAYLKEHQQLTDAQLKADVQEWQSVLSPIESAWNSQLRGLLAGTESWSTAMKKIVGDLIIQIIEYFETLAVKKAALGLANLFGAGPQSVLGGLLGAANPAQVANTAALTALTTAVSALTVAVTGDTAATTAETAASGASAGGGLLGGLGGFLSLFGFAAGTDYVMSGGLALIHQGEAIVPAAARGSGPFTGAGANNSVSAAAMKSMLSAHADAMSEMVASQNRLNAALQNTMSSLYALIKKVSKSS